jgi:hypothetical protein
MTKRFGLALLALPLLALPVHAGDDPFAPSLPWKVDCGANFHFKVLTQENGWGCALGPWYNYWPLEAHFQTPALPQYPFWPAPQALVPGGTAATIPFPPCPPQAIPYAAPAAASPAPVSTPRGAATFKPVGYDASGYYVYPPAAPWWYGR